MRRLLPGLSGVLTLLLSVPALHAGSVALLGGANSASGKLTLNPSGIHVDGAAPSDVALSDILEANFSDAPLQLDYFSSDETPGQLPAGWQGNDIGTKDVGGSYSYAKGIFTLHSGTHEMIKWDDPTEHTYFVGRPWSGDGQWTAHLRDITGNDNTGAGVILRENLDPGTKNSGMYVIEFNNQGGGGVFMRGPSGGYYSHGTTLAPPAWLRITRYGPDHTISSSSDGVKWDTIDQDVSQLSNDTYVGLRIQDQPKPAATATYDHVRFTLPPSLSDILPAGVLLRGGTYLAGEFAPFDISAPNSSGTFHRNGKDVAITADKIAAVLIFPTERRRIAKFGTQAGILLKNDDFIQGDIMGFSPGDPTTVRVNSLMLGISDVGERFGAAPDQCAFVHPAAPQDSDYEVRLTDGSIIRATSIASNNSQLIITDNSGITITVDPAEVAQFRVGSSRAQELLALPWSTPAGKTPVECWEGHGQEQIMAAPAGVPVTFPLPGKFHSLALRVALAPNSPPNAQAAVRVLADGQEIGRTPELKAGDQPRFVQVDLPAVCKTIALQAESITDGTHALLIDPIALRDVTK